MSLHCRQSLHWRLGTHRNHLLGTHLRQKLEMRIRRTSCTSRLACRQEHISHWQPFYTGVWARWSTAGGGCCDTAAFLAASEHDDSFVQEQHGTVVLEFQNISVPQPFSVRFHTVVLEPWNIVALGRCCTAAVVCPCTAALAPASARACRSASARWSTAPRELAGNSAEELENILALVHHCTVHVVHPRTVL